MKCVVVLMGLSVVACGQREPIQQNQVPITDPPPRVAGTTSRLSVPKICPIWAPGGGDIDTPEPALVPGVITAMCAVDDAGGSYGLVEGDKPGAQVAVLPGNHELGVYFGFDAHSGFSPDKVVLTGASANVVAWAAPLNRSTGVECCPEMNPDDQRPVTIVALGEQGLLFSVGHFDTAPIQVAFLVDDSVYVGPPRDAWSTRAFGYAFYVNGPP